VQATDLRVTLQIATAFVMIRVLLLGALLAVAVCGVHSAGAAPFLSVTNPIMPSTADPDVLRVNDTDGTPLFLLTHTVGDDGDFRTSSNHCKETQRGSIVLSV
jgi:P pilus assembly chaperone PapD